MPQTRNRARTNTSGAQEGDTPEKDATKEVKEEGDQVEEQNEDSLLDGGDQEENGEGNEAEEDAEQKTDEDDDKEKKVNESEKEEGAEGEKEEKDGEQKASEDEEKAKKKIPIELDEKAKTNVVVVVGQITYADLGMTELKLPLLKCTTFEMRFFAEEENKKGYLTMVFTKSWDAYAAIDKLRGLEVPRGENTCNYSCWLLDKKTTHTIMHEENTTLTELETQLNANNEQDPSLRSLFVANIPKSATKELLTAIFAEAQDIVLPLAEPGKNKGYCYIEFSEADKLDEYISKYQDIKIEDGEVSSKIVIRKLGKCLSAPITEKTKDRVNRMLKSRALQQIPDLGKKSVSESGRKNVRKGSQNFRGFRRNERFNRQYKPRRYGGGFGPDRRDSPRRNDDGAMALAAIQQLLSQQQMMGRGGRGSGGGGGGGGSGGNFRASKRRYSGGGGGGSYDDYGGMAKNRRFDSPLGMEGPQHFYDDNYDNWGSGSFQQGYGSGSGGGYSGGGGYGGGSGGGGGGGGYGDGRRRKNFGGKFYKRRN